MKAFLRTLSDHAAFTFIASTVLAFDRIKYPHSLRSFHTVMTFQKANHYLPQYPATSALGQPLIFVMDTWNFRSCTYNEYPYIHRLQPNSVELPPPRHYFDGRARQLLQEYAQEGGSRKGIRIVEGLYVFGDREVFTMVKLQLEPERTNTEPRYKLVSSVSRVG